jgi:hypothetical protein
MRRAFRIGALRKAPREAPTRLGRPSYVQEGIMSDLREQVIATHGGLDRWKAFTRMKATIVTGGAFWTLKGLVPDPQPREITLWLRYQRATVRPYGGPDHVATWSPGRVAIEAIGAGTVAERLYPREAFRGHEEATPWDALHCPYFNGYALWTYLTTPFLLAWPGVEVNEIEPWPAGQGFWRRLRAHFPPEIATHSEAQDFFFDSDGLLRRHDYRVDVAGGFPVAEHVFDYVEAQGLRLPTRRRAFRRGTDDRPIAEPLMVSIDIGDVHFE